MVRHVIWSWRPYRHQRRQWSNWSDFFTSLCETSSNSYVFRTVHQTISAWCMVRHVIWSWLPCGCQRPQWSKWSDFFTSLCETSPNSYVFGVVLSLTRPFRLGVWWDMWYGLHDNIATKGHNGPNEVISSQIYVRHPRAVMYSGWSRLLPGHLVSVFGKTCDMV